MRYISRIFTTALFMSAVPAIVMAENITEGNVKLIEAGDTVTVAKMPDDIYLRSVNDPDDIIWERLPEYRVATGVAPSVHESVDLRIDYDQEGYDLFFTPARTKDRLYMRLRWRDTSRDQTTSRNQFSDGVAVQFSLGDDETSYMMGDGSDAPVNIWYWRSDRNAAYSLAAGGPGSTTILKQQPVSGDSRYIEKSNPEANEWTVVMSRAWQAEGEHQVSLDRDSVPVAFAVWQGKDEQRDGLKNVSDGWILLDVAAK